MAIISRRSLRFSFAAVILFAFLVLPRAGNAQPLTAAQALDRLLSAQQVQADWFAPSFLAQATVDQVQSALNSLRSLLGAYLHVDVQSDGSYLATFERGTDRITASVDAQGRFTGLFLAQPTLFSNGLQAAVDVIGNLTGTASVLVTTNGKTRASVRPNTRLAVGSAFKLAVLLALRRRIAAHQLSWTQVATLKSVDKALPSGILQTWPAGSHLTLETLASLMISQSDNTATDVLIRVVGRAAIDPLIPARDRPILTPRELFVLKDPAHASLRDAYLKGSQSQRLAALKRADTLPLPSITLFASGAPLSPQIEWFFSPKELCALMAKVHDLPLMSINPGIADPAQWRRVSFKGGSDGGVLSLTTMVQGSGGVLSCVSAIWNGSRALDENTFFVLYGSLFSALQ